MNEVVEKKSFEVLFFFGPFGKKSRSNGANWKAMKGMEQSHVKGQIVEMGMQRETFTPTEEGLLQQSYLPYLT